MSKESLSIILPTFNEREAICRLVQKILEVVATMNVKTEILVVDDSSPDGTAQMIKTGFGSNPAVRLIERKPPRSLGGSIKDGILASSHNYVLLMDADFNHAPQDIARLFSCMNRAEFINGSRFLRGGGMQKARLRFWASRLFNTLCRVILGLRVTDILSGFIIGKRKQFVALDLEKIFSGYGDFAIRLHYAIKKRRWQVHEIPVKYPPRMGGKSKTRFLKHTWLYATAAIRARFQDL